MSPRKSKLFFALRCTSFMICQLCLCLSSFYNKIHRLLQKSKCVVFQSFINFFKVGPNQSFILIVNRTEHTFYILPPWGFDPQSLGAVSRLMTNKP